MAKEPFTRRKLSRLFVKQLNSVKYLSGPAEKINIIVTLIIYLGGIASYQLIRIFVVNRSSQSIYDHPGIVHQIPRSISVAIHSKQSKYN